MSSKTVPADFRKFVHYIETSQHIYINLSWSSIEEFKDCIAYYFERAVSNLEWTKRFADRAAKLSLLRALSPDNALRKINFKDVLLKESKRHLEDFHQKLESDDSYTLDQATRLFKFIGELFTVEILSLEFLKHQMEILEAKIPRCSISSRCYFFLIGIVKSTVQTISESNYSFTAKNLLKMIDEAELNRFISPSTPKSTPEKLFPRFQTPVTTNNKNEQLERFKRLLEDLTSTNVADVIKKIEKDHQNIVKGGDWQIYYDVMMERALTKHKLAEAVISLCQKIASIGLGIRNGDYKKHMFAYIHKSIEKLFERNEEDAQNRIFGVAHFVEKMIDQSLPSIGTIASFIEVILNNRSKNDTLASKILIQVLFGIKVKTNSEKIRKLPESIRIIAVQLMTSKLSKDPKYGKHVGTFEEYLLGRKSELPPPARAQNIPSTSISQGSIAALKQFNGITNTPIGPAALSSSPKVNKQNIQEDFNFVITPMRQSSMPAAAFQPEPSPISPPESNKFATIIEVIANVNFNDTDDCVKTIKLMNIRKAAEVQCLVATIVQQSLAAQNLTAEYAKLIQQLTELQFNISIAPANVFKVLLIQAYQQKFKESFPVNPSRVPEVYCLVRLIAEIYKVGVFGHKHIENCMVSFFAFESTCEFTVRCISLLLKLVGEIFESQNEDVLNTYFRYFERIAAKENSFRASVFQELLTLRKNKWSTVVVIPKPIELSSGASSSSPPQHLVSSTPPSPVASTSSQSAPAVADTHPPSPIASTRRAIFVKDFTMVIDFQELSNNIELKIVAHGFKQHLKSASQVKSLITAILGHPFNNFNEISSCVNLFKILADIEVSTKSGLQITFRECLLEVFNISLMKTRTSSFDQRKDNAKTAFGNMIVMVGELYKNDLYSDDDLDIWLCHKNLSLVAVEILAHFSSLISQKIFIRGRDQTMLLLKFLEKSIQNLTMEACHSMKNDIDEVIGLFQRMMNSKLNED